MTEYALRLDGGAPVELPEGDRAWRVEGGAVEVYLVGPRRRRLLALIEPGGHLFGLPPDAPVSLAIVSEERATLYELR